MVKKTLTTLGLRVKEGNISVRQDDLILVALWTARLMETPDPGDLGIEDALKRLREALRGAKR